MTTTRSYYLLLPAFGLLSLLLSGCLERKETITVDRNGGVRIRVELEGDPSDFDTGDVLPTREAGWKVEEQMVENDDGSKKLRRIAMRSYRAGSDLPDSFADSDHPQYEVALMSPTDLTVEKRSDGTYYNFKRVYEGREEARFANWQRILKAEYGGFEDMADKSPGELSIEDRTRLIEAIRKMEGYKRCEYVDDAVAAAGEDWPQHYGLLLRQAMLDCFVKSDVSEVVELLGRPESDERDAAINELGNEIVDTCCDDLRAQLESWHVSNSQIEEFFAAYNEAEARRAVTEDLADEVWTVRVEMPGEIIAHNGEQTDDGVVEWGFDAEALHDRDQVLMVTSRVQRGQRR